MIIVPANAFHSKTRKKNKKNRRATLRQPSVCNSIIIFLAADSTVVHRAKMDETQ